MSVEKLLASMHKKYYDGNKRVLIFRTQQKTLRPLLNGQQDHKLSLTLNFIFLLGTNDTDPNK